MGAALNSHEEAILKSLRRISRAIDLYSRQLAQRVGLTGPQLVCMRALVHSDMTPGALAKEVDLSQATITGIMDRLVAAQLVVRRRDESDRRRVTLSLAPKGRELVERAPSPLHDRLVTALTQLSEARRKEIADTLQTVVSMMNAEELDASPILATGPIDSSAQEVDSLLSAGSSALEDSN